MKQPLISIHGQDVSMADDHRLIARQGIILGLYGSQFQLTAPDRFVQHDDFLGAAISSQWNLAKGSDGGCANFAVNVQPSGVVRGVTGAGGGETMAVNGVQICGALNYEASAGGLSFATRLKLSATAGLSLFVGFTNQTAALQMPANGSGTANGITYNAANCCGVLYDTAMTTEDFWLIGNATSVAATAQDSLAAPTATDYDVWQIDIDSSGNAEFFHNGTLVGQRMSGAITPATALSPVVAAFSRATASVDIDLDYLHAGCKRI